MLKRLFSRLLLPTLVVALAACNLGNLNLQVKFSRTSDLKAGDRVIYQDRAIGNVAKITQAEQGHFLVALAIDSNHKQEITDLSIFYITDDPALPGHKAVFTEQEQPGGIPLVDGSVVNGMDHPPYLRHMLRDIRRKAMELSNGLADQLVGQLQRSQAEIEKKMQHLEKMIRTAPDSKEAQELATNIDTLAEDLESSLEKVKTMISVDLSKAIRDTLDGVRKRLEEFNRKDDHSPEEKERDRNIRI
ncbi:MAG: hypothetical protein KKG70_03885 [Proteobacteria bacterium]|nr:hypothetical protein [Pseudomonadota bacterium]